jgi:DNA polymerase III subunit beta
MDLTIPREVLLRQLKRVALVASPRNTKDTHPSASLVRLTAADGALDVHARTLTLEWRGTEPCDMKRSGDTAVDAKTLLDHVGVLPQGPVRLALEGSTLTVAAVGARRAFKIPAGDPTLMSAATAPPEGSGTVLTSAAIIQAIDTVLPIAAKDTTRENMCGVHLVLGGGVLRSEATDGHRAARYLQPVGGDGAFDALIHSGSIRALRSLLESSDDVTIWWERDRALAIRGDAGHLRLSLVSAPFPPLHHIIPQSWTNATKVDRSALADSLRALVVHLGRAADDKPCTTTFSFGSDTLKLSAVDADCGDGEDAVSHEPAREFTLNVGLRAQYMLEAIEACGSDLVEFRLGDPLAPVLVRPCDPARDVDVVVMPIRI